MSPPCILIENGKQEIKEKTDPKQSRPKSDLLRDKQLQNLII